MLRKSKNDQNQSSSSQKSKKIASFVQFGFLSGLLAVLAILSEPVIPAGKAYAASNKQIMKECRKRYGSSVKSWYRAKSGKIVCVRDDAVSQEKQNIVTKYQAQVRCYTIARSMMSPSTNGLLERAMRTVDELEKRKIDPTPIYWKAVSEVDNAREQRDVNAMRKWIRDCRIF